MKEPVDHIIRPRLPWRASDHPQLTECGLDVAGTRTVTRDEFLQRRKDLGQQRTALLTCMTCSNTVSRWQAWEQDPRSAIGREVAWELGWAKDRGHLLKDELMALAALVAAHPDEFGTLLADTEARRQWLEKKATPVPPKPRTMTWRPL
jgi:hypothetical protein